MTSINDLLELCISLKEAKEDDAIIFKKLLNKNPNIAHKRGLYVPENYNFIEKINTLPFKSRAKLLDLFQFISPDLFNSPVKYASQIIDWNLEESLIVGSINTWKSDSYWRWHYILDIMHIFASSKQLIKLLKNENHEAQNVWIEGESGILTPEISEIISENPQLAKSLEYFQIFYHGSNFDFLSSLLSSHTKFKNLKLIEISYLFKELGSLIKYFEEDRFVQKSFPSLERLVLVDQIKPHDPHVFDKSSLDIDMHDDYLNFTTNLFKVAVIGDYELELQGKRYSIANSGTQFKIFGTKLLPNSGDYIELVVDTLLEFKIGSKLSQVKTSDTISKDIISARIPFKNVIKISWAVFKTDFRDVGENYSYVLDEVKRQNPKAKWSLLIENKLTHIQINYFKYSKLYLSEVLIILLP